MPEVRKPFRRAGADLGNKNPRRVQFQRSKPIQRTRKGVVGKTEPAGQETANHLCSGTRFAIGCLCLRGPRPNRTVKRTLELRLRNGTNRALSGHRQGIFQPSFWPDWAKRLGGSGLSAPSFSNLSNTRKLYAGFVAGDSGIQQPV